VRISAISSSEKQFGKKTVAEVVELADLFG
jgi:hypothetical protein